MTQWKYTYLLPRYISSSLLLATKCFPVSSLSSCDLPSIVASTVYCSIGLVPSNYLVCFINPWSLSQLHRLTTTRITFLHAWYKWCLSAFPAVWIWLIWWHQPPVWSLYLVWGIWLLDVEIIIYAFSLTSLNNSYPLRHVGHISSRPYVFLQLNIFILLLWFLEYLEWDKTGHYKERSLWR